MGLFDRFHRPRASEARSSHGASVEPQVKPRFHLQGSGCDYSNVNRNDHAIKIWVPDPVREALNEIVDYRGGTMSGYIRDNLFAYLYGHYDQLALQERCELAEAEILYSRVPVSENRTAHLGKNDRDIKIWISKMMCADLDELAKETGIARSEFVREILVSQLFGRMQLPDRQR